MRSIIKYSLILILVTLIPNQGFTQDDQSIGVWGSNMHKADMLYDQQLYEEALAYYETELEKYNFDDKIILKMAECYRYLGDYQKMRDYYFNVMKTSSVKAPINTFYYAEGLLSTGKYEDAANWFEVYLKSKPDDEIAKARLEGLINVNTFFRDSSYVFADTVNFNSDKTDLGPYWYKGGILFSSGRPKDAIINHDHLRSSEPLLDLYYIRPDQIELEPERIKLTKYYRSNDGPLTVGNSQIIITRNSTNKSDSVHNMGLYILREVVNESDLKTSWDKIEDFPYNSKEYSIAHPALSENEDTLFYASDMPGGFGGSDLYYSIDINGGWSKPVNMGENVNTPGSESFPFYRNGNLYFASNGHPGLGGKDIYRLNISSGMIFNMGYPINSGYDDISFIIDENFEGYFASNRPGGKGKDDIYYFGIKELPPMDVYITFKDLLNDNIVTESEVTIFDLENTDSLTFTADTSGVFKTRLPIGVYDVAVNHEDYNPHSFLLNITANDTIYREVYLDPDFKLDNIKLDSILFDFNEFKLSTGAGAELDFVVDLMREYPMLKLEINAHTDSRGNAEYNLWLSEMRATSTANYLVSKEIDFDRLIFNGYGEFKPLNHCVDGVHCTEEEYSVNRRIELNLIKEEDK